jgi:hypothetical protein
METDMKVSGVKVLCKGREFTILLMVENMKVNGKRI